MKKIIGKFFMGFFVLMFMLNVNTEIANAVPYMEAQGVVLMDGITGEILYSKSPHVQFEPASTTKIMTAIVVLENAALDELVTVGPNPPMSEGSGIYIKEGQVYTVEEMLLALLLESANDCAEALAEHISGSLSDFGVLMTEKAREIGAMDTVFKNPSGLHEPGHVTTAYDLALIMKYAFSKPEFVNISRVLEYTIQSNYKEIANRNNCLAPWSPWYYDYLYSGKTGWTPEANHTYAAVAIKDDQVLISSYLNAFNKDAQYTGVAELFNYGFDNYKTIKVVKSGDFIENYKISEAVEIPLYASKDIYYTDEISSIENLDIKYELIEEDISNKEFNIGDTLFNCKVFVDGAEYDTFQLLSGAERKLSGFEWIRDESSKISEVIIIISIIVVLLIAGIFLKNKKVLNKFKIYKK